MTLIEQAQAVAARLASLKGLDNMIAAHTIETLLQELCNKALEQPEQEQSVRNTDELPSGFVSLLQENGRVVYAACMDRNARHYKWLMCKHPDGRWVSKRKLENWEVMQVEDQEHYGIVQEAATQPQPEPVAWVGCGECDTVFPCTKGQARCIRLQKPEQERNT